MTREEADFIGGMNMCDEISNEAYKKIMCHCEEPEPCEDAISRAEVIDELNRIGRNAFKEDTDYDNFFAFLDNLTPVQPQTKTGRWIPVSERLPKYNTPVLLALKQIGKERAIVIGERRTRKSGWYFVDIAAYDTEHEVIAWMPLPEPYKPQESEK